LAAWAQKLMPRVRALYRDEPNVIDLAAPIYAVDSTLIDLSLALCPWANWTGGDAAVKLQAALDLRGPLPAFLNITPATVGDVLWLDELPLEPGAFYVLDRGYVDFRRLRRIAEAGVFFVIRERPDVRYYVSASRPVDRTTGLRSDQSIRLNGSDAPRHWPDLLRRVSLFDAEQSRRLAFWTNHWLLSAALIAELYRHRWQIELFFRWLKHGLRIHTFYGTSPNAVRHQLMAAICTYLAMAITRKQLGITTNLTTFVQVLSLHAISKVPIESLFTDVTTSETTMSAGDQLLINDL
jgi:transposase